ncbi:MAG: hypothetical protein LIO60_04100 [Oscillospiraceae bacterium]|nr:hypothetical protein [Oscillospiraceae bacterium]
MQRRRIRIEAFVAAALLLAGVSAYAAGSYGSSSDPLITKSYLDEVVQPQLEAAVEEATGAGTFAVVTLDAGDRVTCAVGTELVLRFGSAAAYAYDSADTALVDTTTAAALQHGSVLNVNHLYMVTIAGNGFTAGSGGAKLLISGEYTVG